MRIIFLLLTILLNTSLFGQKEVNVSLVKAIKQNEIIEFKKLLYQVDDINQFIPENLHIDDYNKLTLLGFTCAYKRIDMVKYLINKKADVKLGLEDDYYIYDALYSLYQKDSKNKDNAKIAKILIQSGANVNSIYGDNARSILHIACSQNDLAMVRLLLFQGADPNNAGNLGVEYRYYPLIEAVKNNNLSITRLLLKYKANIHVKDENNRTPLDYAKDNHNVIMIQLLSN